MTRYNFGPGDVASKEDFTLNPNHIIRLHSSITNILVQSPPPGTAPYDIHPDQALRVIRQMAKSQASVYEVEFGSVTGSGKVKRAFVKDTGRYSVAMKMVWVSRNSDEESNLRPEFAKNSLLMNDPTNPKNNPEVAHDTIVPTLCRAMAGWQTQEQMEKGEPCTGFESMRIMLMPLHLDFRSDLGTDKYTEDEKIELWNSSYAKLQNFHSLGYAHRDVKRDNFVVKARRDEEGVLVPWKSAEGKMEVLLIDVPSARKSTELGSSGLCPSGTGPHLSFTEAMFFLKRHYEQAVDKNPHFQPDISSADYEKIQEIKQELMWPDVIWTQSDTAGTDLLFKIAVKEKVHIENDVWALGIALLGFLDSDYVKATCFRMSFLTEFQRLVPLEGEPAEASAVQEFLEGFANFFSPLFDTDPTWKERVPQKWWRSLELMLKRPSEGLCWRAVKNQKKISEQITDELKRLADEENKKGQKRKAAEIEEDKSALAAPESFTTKAKSPSPQAHTGTTASTGAESSTKLRNKTDSYVVKGERQADSWIDFKYPHKGKTVAEDGTTTHWKPKFKCPFDGVCTKIKGGEGSYETNVFADMGQHYEPAFGNRCKWLKQGIGMIAGIRDWREGEDRARDVKEYGGGDNKRARREGVKSYS